MPIRKQVWSAWNYAVPNRQGELDSGELVLTYWMNRLQNFIPKDMPLFVTLNPGHNIDREKVLETIEYHHPIFHPKVRRDIIFLSNLTSL